MPRIQRRKPNPQLAQALSNRPPSIQQRVENIRARTHLLRAATYLLTLADRRFTQ
jgi:hypothetical protein